MVQNTAMQNNVFLIENELLRVEKYMLILNTNPNLEADKRTPFLLVPHTFINAQYSYSQTIGTHAGAHKRCKSMRYVLYTNVRCFAP